MKKSTEQKIQESFSKISIILTPRPANHLIHLYADYVELVSLFSNRNYVSKSDILDRFRDEGIFKREKNDEDIAEEYDECEIFIDSIYRELLNRSLLYNLDYPFIIEDENKIILLEKAKVINRHKIYIFLLLSSSLNLFDTFQPELTSEFELISYYTLKSYLPTSAQVKSFGKNSDYPSGTAIEKIKLLANDLQIQTDDHSLSQISTKGVQERGLDLIGWIPHSDGIPNLTTILCQCACGKEWYKKLSESIRYENYFKFYRKHPIHAMFIPYSQINYQDSSFYQSDEITNTLLFDRKRILSILSNTDFFDDLQSCKVINKCLEYEEDIV